MSELVRSDYIAWHLTIPNAKPMLLIDMPHSAVSLEVGGEHQDQKPQPPTVSKDEVRPAIHVMVLMNGYDTVVPHLVHTLACGKRSVSN